MPTTYAVVEASRGIGLEYVHQLSARPDTTVFAVVRNILGSTLLTSFAATAKNVHVIEGDASDHSSLQRTAKEISQITGGKLDFLIHNAARMTKDLLYLGFNDYKTMHDLDEDLVDTFRVNTLGVAYSVDAFLPLLRAGPTKKIIIIGTGGASYKFVRTCQVQDMLAYCVTKASGTMLAVKYALHLAPEGFTVVTLSPGLVETDSTSVTSTDSDPVKERLTDLTRVAGEAAQTPELSVKRQLVVIDGLTIEDSGKFLTHMGDDFSD